MLRACFVEYYRQHIQRQDSMQRSTAATRLSAPPTLHRRLVSQPLFWTSVVSVFLALVCTIAIVVLCLVSSRRSRRARAVRGSRAARANRSVAPPYADDKQLNDRDDHRSLANISSE